MDLHERVQRVRAAARSTRWVCRSTSTIDDDARQRPRRARRRRRRGAAPAPRRSARRAAAHRQHRVPARAEGRSLVRRRLPRLPQGQGRRAAADGAVHDGEGEDRPGRRRRWGRSIRTRAASCTSTVAEDPQMSSESIGDAFLKTVIISVAEVDASGRRSCRALIQPMFSHADDTIVAIATPPGRGGIGVVRISGPDAHAHRAARSTGARRRFEPRHATLRARRRPRRGAARSGGRHVLPAPALLHRRRRRRDQRARQPGAAARDRRRGDARRRAARRAGRVHVARVPERPDRSRAGGGGARSDRRGDAAAGARGVRSARRHADRAHPRRSTRRCSISSARLEASLDFPDEGYHFVDAGGRAARDRAVVGAHRRAARRRRARPADPRRRARS